MGALRSRPAAPVELKPTQEPAPGDTEKAIDVLQAAAHEYAKHNETPVHALPVLRSQPKRIPAASLARPSTPGPQQTPVQATAFFSREAPMLAIVQAAAPETASGTDNVSVPGAV